MTAVFDRWLFDPDRAIACGCRPNARRAVEIRKDAFLR